MTYVRHFDESKKYGFVYIWFDRHHKRYYIGSHWGTIDDGYVCSSTWMRNAMRMRPSDFKRRIIKTNIPSRGDTFEAEHHYLQMIKESEIKPANSNPRYYNISRTTKEPWYKTPEGIKTVGAKISAAKKGKSVPAPPDRGAKISAAKKGKKFSEQHKEALRQAKIGTIRSEEAKRKTSESLKKNWAESTTRPRKQPKETMIGSEQDQRSADRLKSK